MDQVKVKVFKGGAEKTKSDVMVVFIFAKTNRISGELKSLDQALDGGISRLIKSKDVTGKSGQSAWLFPAKAAFKRLLLVGLGPRNKFSAEIFRRVMGTTAREVRRFKCPDVAVVPPDPGEKSPTRSELARAAVEGMILGAYQFTQYKGKAEKDKSRLKKLAVLTNAGGVEYTAVKKSVERGRVVAEAVAMARDLANTPGNDLYPDAFSKIAAREAKKHGLKFKVLGVQELRKEKMNAILAVGGGSSRSPRMAVIEYRPEKVSDRKKAPLVFVGKGITFDSGGISIKPSANMGQMKYDMSGAAAALALITVAAQRGWKRPVVTITPLAENLSGSKAYRPGDVVTTSSGIKVEVLNTDAEGRMILSDALHYAKRYKPEAVIDLATLTGAVTIALGAEAIGLMSKNKSLAEKILEAGRASGEWAWQLPLWEEYDESIKSDVADIKNVGGRAAGTITAGAFLKKFTKGYKWAHLDIAGTAWSDRDVYYKPKGATGAGVRILAELGEKF